MFVSTWRHCSEHSLSCLCLIHKFGLLHHEQWFWPFLCGVELALTVTYVRVCVLMGVREGETGGVSSIAAALISVLLVSGQYTISS